MRIRTKKMYSLIAVFMFLFVIVSCGKTEEKEPTLTITSEKNAVIELNESYQLEYTTKDAKEVEVELSDGIENGNYDKESKIFTATSGGEYTLTLTATNVTKTATDTVKITVNDADSPTITFEDELEEEYRVNIDEEFILPKATAKDAFERDVEVVLESSDLDIATISKNDDGEYVLTGITPGEVVIKYSAKDEYSNETTEHINVFVTIDIEPTITFTDEKLESYEALVGDEVTLPGAIGEDA